ncbi:hypothetical protein EJD97_008775 [Solanum chilense]|uniref:Uncharacterized protein n=1 Tax=Solanum chilense TaxID=4083 RepID=A0A6N2CE38_SOLCI|nr:hypothetical protein EJD97_008775 [Solanum chilense]
MEAVRRASLADEEARQMRAVELAAGASSSRNVEIAGGTADSVVDVEDTTEAVQYTEVVGSRELNHQLADRRRPRFASPSTLVFQFLYALGIIACLFCWGWGKWKVSARVKSE